MDRKKLSYDDLSYADLLYADFEDFDEQVTANTANHLIANGIGDITTEKHRADVAEEALRNACKSLKKHIMASSCKYCIATKVCKSDDKYCTELIENEFIKQAEANLKERV